MLLRLIVIVQLLEIGGLTESTPPPPLPPLEPALTTQSDRSTVAVMMTAQGVKSRGFFVGEFCDDSDQCSVGPPHTVCNAMSQRCECDPAYPIVVDATICVQPLKLGDRCVYDQSCQYYDRNAVCQLIEDSVVSECRCRPQFLPSITLESIARTSICIPEPHGPWLKSDVPTVIGLGVGMSIFMALVCLVLKLFSRARFAQDQARGYGNAHLAPPRDSLQPNSTSLPHHHQHHHQHQQQHHPHCEFAGKHRPSICPRQASITDSEMTETQQQQRTERRANSITSANGNAPLAGQQQQRSSAYSLHGRRQSIQSSGVDRSGSTRSCRSSRNYAQHQHHQHHQQQQHELGGGGGRRRDSSGPEGDPSASSSAEHLQPIN